MTIVTVHQAKTTLSRLIQQALDGEEVVIARGDTPVVRLVPLAAEAPARAFGAWKGKLRVDSRFFEPLPDDELSEWQQ